LASRCRWSKNLKSGISNKVSALAASINKYIDTKPGFCLGLVVFFQDIPQKSTLSTFSMRNYLEANQKR